LTTFLRPASLAQADTDGRLTAESSDD